MKAVRTWRTDSRSRPRSSMDRRSRLVLDSQPDEGVLLHFIYSVRKIFLVDQQQVSNCVNHASSYSSPFLSVKRVFLFSKAIVPLRHSS